MKIDRQVQFLKNIEQERPPNIAFVSELADLLGVSNDSAYRRLRGETALTFDEIGLLCNFYKVSFDDFNSDQTDQVVTFRYNKMVGSAANFKTYFGQLGESMRRVKEAASGRQIIYAGQGMPIFYYFNYPALAAFKIFHWMKSGIDPAQGSPVFSPDLIDPELLEIGKSLFNDYLQIPSTEIWSDTIAMGTIHQIQFYWDSGNFKDSETALQVCAQFRSLLEHVQSMCALGKKQDNFDNPAIRGEKLNLYYCEIELEKVCVLVNVGTLRRIYLGQLSFGSMYTENHEYYQETEEWLQSIIQKSNLITGVSQTIRHQFFKRSLANLQKIENRIREES